MNGVGLQTQCCLTLKSIVFLLYHAAIYVYWNFAVFILCHPLCNGVISLWETNLLCN